MPRSMGMLLNPASSIVLFVQLYAASQVLVAAPDTVCNCVAQAAVRRRLAHCVIRTFVECERLGESGARIRPVANFSRGAAAGLRIRHYSPPSAETSFKNDDSGPLESPTALLI